MLCTLLVLAGVAPPTLVASTRTPIAVVLSRPTGAKAAVRLTDLIRDLETTITSSTDLKIVQVETEALADCEGDIGCMVQRLPPPPPAYLLLVTWLTADGEADRVATMLVDVPGASSCGGERACLDKTVLMQTKFEKLATEEEWTRWVQDLVATQVRRELERAGHWIALGDIQLVVDAAGASVRIDDRDVGIIGPGGASIVDVRPGSHELVVESLDEDVYRTTVTVRAGESLRQEMSLGRHRTERAISMYAGIGVAAVGVALTVATIVAPTGGIACTTPPCPNAGFITVERLFAGRIHTLDEDRNDGSILALPLGYSMVITGATISGLLAFVAEDGEAPWLSIAIGVGAGVLAYGVSAVAN